MALIYDKMNKSFLFDKKTNVIYLHNAAYVWWSCEMCFDIVGYLCRYVELGISP